MYNVSESVINNIKEEFIRELDKRHYEYSLSAIDNILDEWCRQKQMLLSLLSKHPNWNAESLMIHFDADFSRKLDTASTRNFLYWLQDNKVNETADEAIKWDRVLDFISRYCMDRTYLPEECDSEVTEGMYDSYGNWTQRRFKPLTEINELIPELHARVGQKTTKVVGKICTHFGIDKIKKYGTRINPVTGEVEDNALIDSYDKQFAKFCDALSPIKITRHTCISLNPIDYLLMSNGNSWRSCHYIGDYASDSGCYSSGTISYMLDQHSIIFYTVDAGFDGVCIEREPKISRQVFGYNDFQLLQSRLYPQNNDIGASDTYTDIRNIMQKVVADCLVAPNRWIKKSVHNVEHGNGATCYPDWDCQSSLCSTSILRGKENDDLEPIVLGAEPICVECGYRHHYDGNINCCNSKYTCECCGSRINEDDVYWVGDSPYCCDCVTYCERCGDYELNDDATYIPSEDRYVCQSCLEYYYTYCDDCEEYVSNDNATYIDEYNKYVCDDCLAKYYSECKKCGNWVDNEYLNADGLCENCVEEMEDEEEDENE
ncbi:MAG: hypothetical protein PUE12_18485 [Oscillospiraceae bacterium]|nr:hypothetical protein [Oscillospiraceae bacterium]